MSYADTLANQNEFARRALERAAQRNGGQDVPASNPGSVTVANDMPSRAVDRPVPYVGTNGGEK